MTAKQLLLMVPAVAILAAGVTPATLSAQSLREGSDRGRVVVDRDDDRWEDDDDRWEDDDDRWEDDEDRWEDDDDRWEDERGRDRREDRGRRDRGPKFCSNGQGHPVHGMRWCRDRGFGDGYGDRWDRIGDIDRRDYERAHQLFHRDLDRRYAELAARRPTDSRYLLRLRQERQEDHDRWHRQVGYAHR